MTWWTGSPRRGVARPVVDPDYTATVGLARDQRAPWSRPPTLTGAAGPADGGGDPAELPVALGDHFRPRGPGATLREVQDYAGHKDPRLPGATTTPGTAWTATPPTR